MGNALFSRWTRRAGRGAAACWLLAFGAGLPGAASAQGKACVWKVTDASTGHTLYLAGSIHALRSSDYPLPGEYDEALNASAGVAFETDLSAPAERWSDEMTRAGRLPEGVTLRDKVDPRTYAYMKRVIVKFHGSEEPLKRIEHLKPWYISMMLDSPHGGLAGVSIQRGVETHVIEQARKGHKRMEGLVPLNEHIAVFGGMNDADSEAQLLLGFIHLDHESASFNRTVAAWKRGDIATIDRDFDEDYHDVPSLRRRLLAERNRRWLPKIEGYLHSGRTWMVVAGAGHMAGNEGLPALLQAHGWKVEQI